MSFRRFVPVCFTVLLFSCAHAQSFQVINRDWFHQLRSRQSDTVYVVNFWATWCKPCVEELPEFNKLADRFHNKKVTFYLVSNDLRKDTGTRLHTFIAQHPLKPQVLWINETNPNNWIDLVDKTWSGAIPATWIVYKKDGHLQEYFFESTIDADQLDPYIHQHIH